MLQAGMAPDRAGSIGRENADRALRSAARRVRGWTRDMLIESVRWVFSSARNRPFGSVSAPCLPYRVPVLCVLVRGTCLLRRFVLAAPFSLGRGRSRHRSG